MAKKIADAFVLLHPDTKGFGKEFQHAAAASGREVGESFAGNLIKKVGELFAAEKVFEFFKGSVERAEEAEKLAKLTEAVIKSTHGAARVSAEDVDKLSRALSGVSGVDDELIHNSANVLLTFTQIRNAAGKGNDIFNQATSAILDMSAALHTDLQGATIQVGKALNDPVKGITALRRVGVSFTQSQIDMIKHLVATGHTMDAQKLILRELRTEFGGAAAAAATPMAKAQVAWQNFQELVGGLFLPTIGRVADFFTSKVAPALQTGTELLSRGWNQGAKDGAGFLQQFGAIARRVFDDVGKVITTVIWPVLKDTVITLHDFIGWINKGSEGAQYMRAAFIGLGAALAAYKIYQGILGAIALATKVWTAAQWLLNIALDANPVGLIILAVVALAAAIFYLWTHSESFRKFFIGLWGHIWGFMKAVGAWFAGPFAHFFVKLYESTKATFLAVIGVFIWLRNKQREIAEAIWKWLKARWQAGVDDIKAKARLILGIVAYWADLQRRVIQAVKDWFAKVASYFAGLPGRLKSALGNLGHTLYDAGADLIRGLWDGIKSMGGWLSSKVSGFIDDNVPGPVKKLLGIGSPSRLFRGFGRNTVQGYAQGFQDEVRNARLRLPTVAASQLPVAAPAGNPANQLPPMTPDDWHRLLVRAFREAMSELTLRLDDRTGQHAYLYGRAG